MSKHSNDKSGSNPGRIVIPLPVQQEMPMNLIVNDAAKLLQRALREFPEKLHGSKRWVTTGLIDFRPGGSVNYFVSYESRTGYGQ